MLAVHCDFYSTLQQSPETAAKDTERTKTDYNIHDNIYKYTGIRVRTKET